MSTSGITWEYQLLYHSGPAPLDWLNERGAEGWEVVLAQPVQEERGMIALQTAGHYWLFKRMRMEHPAITLEQETVRPLEWSFEREFQAAKAQNPDAAGFALMPAEQPEMKRKSGQWSDEARARARERGKVQAAKRRERTDAEPAQQATGG